MKFYQQQEILWVNHILGPYNMVSTYRHWCVYVVFCVTTSKQVTQKKLIIICSTYKKNESNKN